MKIHEAFEIVKNAESANKIIIDFCKNQIPTPTIGWTRFNNFTIKDTKIHIQYIFGVVEMDYDDTIIVDMTDILRDGKINEIL